jgi:hypothetical protein
LGPLLFLIFINDVDAECKSNTTSQLFGDDAKLYLTVDFSAHSISLQQSLDNLCVWADQWQLSINIGKCSVLSVASKSHQVYPYFINGISIPTNSTTSDLGDDLTYQTHITNIDSSSTLQFARAWFCIASIGYNAYSLHRLYSSNFGVP